MENWVIPKVLIIGGSKGLGYNVAQHFALQNYEVLCLSRSGEAPQGCQALKLDLAAPPEELESELRSIIKTIWLPDITVISAGLGAYTSRTHDEQISRILDTNLRGVLSASESILRIAYNAARHDSHPLPRRVVLVGSAVSRHGANGLQWYAATKAALQGYVLSACRRPIRRNIALALYEPGFFESPMTAEIKPEIKDAILRFIPAHRMGKLDEVAQDLWLICQRPVWCLSGSIINAAGGY